MSTVHDVPGRLRVKFNKLRNNPYRLNQIRDMLRVDGVYEIKTNDLTGSVVVSYDSLAIDADRLLSVLSENGYPLEKQVSAASPGNAHEKIALTLGKAAFSWIAGRVLDANGLSYIAAFI